MLRPVPLAIAIGLMALGAMSQCRSFAAPPPPKEPAELTSLQVQAEGTKEIATVAAALRDVCEEVLRLRLRAWGRGNFALTDVLAGAEEVGRARKSAKIAEDDSKAAEAEYRKAKNRSFAIVESERPANSRSH